MSPASQSNPEVPRSPASVVRVLHVTTGLAMGGAEAMLASLVGTPSTKTQHAVVSLIPNGFHAPRIRAKGIQVFELRFDLRVRAPREIWRLAAIIDEYAPDIVQGWMYHGNLAAMAASWLARLRPRATLVWGIRCTEVGPPARERPRARHVVGSWVSPKCDYLVANSEAGLEYHRHLGYACRRSLVIHNGVDTKRFSPDPDARASLRRTLGIGSDEVVLAHVARLDPVKDHATFVQALRLLPNVRALAVGTGTESLPPLPNLLRLGPRTDVPSVLSAADIVVSSSVAEGFSNAVAEGMAVGLVPVGTDVGDTRILVGDTGAVVAPGSPQVLADAIRPLVAMTAAERATRGVRARERIQSKFTLEIAIRNFEQLYATIAAERAAEVSMPVRQSTAHESGA